MNMQGKQSVRQCTSGGKNGQLVAALSFEGLCPGLVGARFRHDLIEQHSYYSIISAAILFFCACLGKFHLILVTLAAQRPFPKS